MRRTALKHASHQQATGKARFFICLLLFLLATILALFLLFSAASGGKHSGMVTPVPKDGDLDKQQITKTVPPDHKADSPESRAQEAVAAMTKEERVGQLIMVPLFSGSDPSTLADLISGEHVGSVLAIGNWQSGTAGFKSMTDKLQGLAPSKNKLIIATDQEGGQVQHLKGTGFDTMPSGVEQGRMDIGRLRQSAKRWGEQLHAAGINLDLAPVTDTLLIDRASNAPIGALDRDFGLDAQGNAEHASAFIQGMSDADVQSVIKHYPGLGAVRGNTDFTQQGVIDSQTSLDSDSAAAFTKALEAKPAMVMMSLATYQHIDPNQPAAFSPQVIDHGLRARTGYQGVVISDSLSAAAVSGMDPGQLGIRLVQAGGDLACIGSLELVQPIVAGLVAMAHSDPNFAQSVTRSATRIMTLKYKMGLAS